MKRVNLQPAFILHRRSYRETSFLIEIWTEELGRLTVLAKGSKQRRGGMAGLLQPFIPLFMSFAGRGELLTLTQAEVRGEMMRLQGDGLFAGFYLNELLMQLLEKNDPHPRLFQAYQETVCRLQAPCLDQKTLRSFELILLDELGYGILPRTAGEIHETFQAHCCYRFIPEQGLIVTDSTDDEYSLFSGANLLAIAQENWHTDAVVQDAKRLIRFLLAPLLGARPIHSRKLFMQMQEK